MSIDLTALALNPIYSILSSSLTLEDGTTISVIDKTSGITINEGIGIETIKPAAAVRKQSLIDANIDIEALVKTDVTLNNKTWTILNYKVYPGINGENDGEIYLILQEND